MCRSKMFDTRFQFIMFGCAILRVHKFAYVLCLGTKKARKSYNFREFAEGFSSSYYYYCCSIKTKINDPWNGNLSTSRKRKKKHFGYD